MARQVKTIWFDSSHEWKASTTFWRLCKMDGLTRMTLPVSVSFLHRPYLPTCNRNPPIKRDDELSAQPSSWLSRKAELKAEKLSRKAELRAQLFELLAQLPTPIPSHENSRTVTADTLRAIAKGSVRCHFLRTAPPTRALTPTARAVFFHTRWNRPPAYSHIMSAYSMRFHIPCVFA